MSTPANRLLAVVILLCLWPVLLVIAGLVKWKLGSPVLFRQVRPGLHGVPFEMVKFRSMTDAREADGELLPDADRLTEFGRMLRSTSLDELPELWNVARGEMHLVGPRPLLMEYLDEYTPQQARRMEVPPGITGLAQISGRNDLAWEDRFAVDVEYVDTRNWRLDLRILSQTLWAVIRRHGIAADGHATMSRFDEPE